MTLPEQLRAKADAFEARDVENDFDPRPMMKLHAALISAVDSFEWVMPKFHQAYHAGEISDCQAATCIEFKKALSALQLACAGDGE